MWTRVPCPSSLLDRAGRTCQTSLGTTLDWQSSAVNYFELPRHAFHASADLPAQLSTSRSTVPNPPAHWRSSFDIITSSTQWSAGERRQLEKVYPGYLAT